MVARTDLKDRIATVLKRRLHDELGNGARVTVEKSDYRDYLHIFVTTPRFKGMSRPQRGAKIWSWLEDEFARRELVKITLVLGLTPAEKKQLLGAG